MSLQALLRTKSIEQLQSEIGRAGQFRRVLGELVAWVIGWDLLLEYALVVAVVSIGWSGYLQALLSQLGLTLPSWAMGAPRTGAGHVLDLAAMLGSLGVAGLLTLRIEWGARFNAAMAIIKIAAAVLAIAAGLPYVHTANWHPFMPCPSSEFLRQLASPTKGGSDPSVFDIKRPARGAASGDLR